MTVCTHVNGDGDGWGSACALAHHYGSGGARVHLLAASPYPDGFRFLLPDGCEPLAPDHAGFDALRAADLQVVVDASEPGRLGDFADGHDPARTLIIDHHAVVSESLGADLALIDGQASATAELIYDVLTLSGAEIAVPTALALYVGIVTDTGSFRYSNSTPRTHRLAAKFIELGIDPEEIYGRLFGNLTSAEIGTLRAALAGLEHDPESGITWTRLDAALTREFGPLDDYDLIVEHVRNLRGTGVAVLFRELPSGAVKVSLRANGPANVAEVARDFGGGGHVKAAGATVDGPLDDAVDRVLDRCRQAVRAARDRRS